MNRLANMTYTSSGMTIGMSLMHWHTVGVIVGIIATVVLAAVTVYTRYKKYLAAEQVLKLQKCVLEEQLENEKRKNFRNDGNCVCGIRNNSNCIAKPGG